MTTYRKMRVVGNQFVYNNQLKQGEYELDSSTRYQHSNVLRTFSYFDIHFLLIVHYFHACAWRRDQPATLLREEREKNYIKKKQNKHTSSTFTPPFYTSHEIIHSTLSAEFKLTRSASSPSHIYLCLYETACESVTNQRTRKPCEKRDNERNSDIDERKERKKEKRKDTIMKREFLMIQVFISNWKDFMKLIEIIFEKM